MLPEAPQAGEKYRILIVEDDLNIGRLLTSGLTKTGFQCRLVPDGSMGLAAFHEIKPHLVISDVSLPGMDGRELCTRIRQSSTVPIIMMTGADTEELELKAFQVGADDYVSKPFKPQLLVARVMSHLRRVYRYKEAGMAAGGAANTRTVAKADAAGSAQARKIPMGWGVCEACGYMGPQSKFESDAGSGRLVLQCPVCKQENRVAFPLG